MNEEIERIDDNPKEEILNEVDAVDQQIEDENKNQTISELNDEEEIKLHSFNTEKQLEPVTVVDPHSTISDEEKIIKLRNEILTDHSKSTNPVLWNKLMLNKRVIEANNCGTGLPRFNDRYLYQGMINRCINALVDNEP